ncbi:MAG: hypothetical protein HY505_01780 [Candidatus Yanofskybacteria bacterium]|nr:hypothetical protein [Candidatus Yanofskybacteria bacterium]
MEREKTKSLSPDSVRNLESSKFTFRDLKSAIEDGGQTAFRWVEDSIIMKMSIVRFKKDALGKEAATVNILNPETQKEETIYYTVEESEVARFKSILRGEVVLNDLSEENPEK